MTRQTLQGREVAAATTVRWAARDKEQTAPPPRTASQPLACNETKHTWRKGHGVQEPAGGKRSCRTRAGMTAELTWCRWAALGLSSPPTTLDSCHVVQSAHGSPQRTPVAAAPAPCGTNGDVRGMPQQQQRTLNTNMAQAMSSAYTTVLDAEWDGSPHCSQTISTSRRTAPDSVMNSSATRVRVKHCGCTRCTIKGIRLS